MPDALNPPDPDTPPPQTESVPDPMPVRVPPAHVADRLDHTNGAVPAELATALLHAVRNIHAACAEHRSHGNRAVPVADLDRILGRHLQAHIPLDTTPSGPAAAAPPTSTSATPDGSNP
jgi:hypothetical protein